MATHYIEFDSNSQTLMADLRTQMLTSTDWARLTSDTVLLNTNGSTAAGATSLPFAATGSSGLSVGSIIMIDDGSVREYRTITAMTSTTITVAAMTYAHASGTAIRWGNELYRATTTRGAQMVIDLNDQHFAVTDTGLKMAVYATHDGTTGLGKSQRFLHWRTTAGAATHPLHVILSLGKEHFFLSIEGPRAGETGAMNANYGSLRNYAFLSDLVPYDAGDTVPVVFAGGQSITTWDGAFANQSHIGHVSRNLQNTGYWSAAKLATLDFAKGGFAETLNLQRQRQVDNKHLLAPYVVFVEDTGMRGRLASFFFAGYTVPDVHEVPPPPITTKVEYQGQWYKLLPVTKSDSARHCWSQFGASAQATAGTYARSVVVAVPCLP